MASRADMSDYSTSRKASSKFSGGIGKECQEEVTDGAVGSCAREGSDQPYLRCLKSQLANMGNEDLFVFLNGEKIPTENLDGISMEQNYSHSSVGNLESEEAGRAAGSYSVKGDWSFEDPELNNHTFTRDFNQEALNSGLALSLPGRLNAPDFDEETDFVRDSFLFTVDYQDIDDVLRLEVDGMLEEEWATASLTYPLGELKNTECLVCFCTKSLNLRPCCAFPVCTECLEIYFKIQVSEAIVKISCPNPECSQKVHRDEILARLDVEMKLKFSQFLVDANKEPHRKTCPRCSHIMEIDLQLLYEPATKKYGLQVQCAECALIWCFPCQAPWHENLKCKDYRRGDKLVKIWARERPQGHVNAQRCPSCKVFIQRSAGCDHMTCSHCNTHFCYQCGKQFRELKFIGNHYSKLSIFGCKYLYKPDNPTQRKLVRGSIFGAKLLAAPVLGGLALGAGAVVAGIGLVALPFYGGYKLHKKLQARKMNKKQRKLESTIVSHQDLPYYNTWEVQMVSNFPHVIRDHLPPTEDNAVTDEYLLYEYCSYPPEGKAEDVTVVTPTEAQNSSSSSAGEDTEEQISLTAFLSTVHSKKTTRDSSRSPASKTEPGVTSNLETQKPNPDIITKTEETGEAKAESGSEPVAPEVSKRQEVFV